MGGSPGDLEAHARGTYRLESSSVDRGEVPGEGGKTPGEEVEGSPGDLEAPARGTSDPRCTVAKTVSVHHPAENDKIRVNLIP